MYSSKSKYLIVGGGIVGLATAYQVQRRDPDSAITLIEKESAVAQHQTGHNSGVLHSGIYYKPGSLKAINCREGKLAMQSFCDQHEIPYDLCGKVIVALDEKELPALQRIYDRGQANGVTCEMIDRSRLLELEPHVAGIQAIHVRETGIVDYKQISEKLAEVIRIGGATIHLATQATRIERRGTEIVVETNRGEFKTETLINCAGLYSDRVTKMSGLDPGVKIVPFRGEYYELTEDARHLCRNLIYPVPDPNFPFLGVHFTRMIDGSVECGPNAVLALAREGYKRLTIAPGDLAESLSYGGFLQLAAKYWRMGAAEMWRSASKPAFVKALQRLVPEIRGDQLIEAPAGVRAQAVAANGTMVDDFLIVHDGNIVNVCNAPSPAATSALHIGQLITGKIFGEPIEVAPTPPLG